MIGAAACLKVQINDDLPVIQSYVDTNNDDPLDIQYEQIAVFSLLSPYFINSESRASWDLFSKTGLRPIGARMVIGTNIFPPNNIMVMAAFNEYTLKGFLSSFSSDLVLGADALPSDWVDMVNATPINELQTLIDDHAGSNDANFNYTGLRINHQPATLTLHRCTAEEVENLYRGDHDLHIDVFDAVKEMLVSQWPALDENGLSQAVYDKATDTIIFKSDFTIIATPAPA
ncbi:hypothetical protein ACT3RN_00570 [Psychrobacter sp. AOP5-GZ1-6]|uniref:hypothetical protein n=1 Tax=Psychrobacter sp. AOP5-GZ1-6 TaxID=3457649 RepID=UPI00402BC8F6